jgi:aminoglycoside 2'-N-acetyltransferase I
MMGELRVAHTADLEADMLKRLRELMDVVFPDDFEEYDWEHALGGMHALITEDGAPVAHASLVMRRLIHQGKALRAGYVEAVGVHPEHRRKGLGGAVMEPLERIVRNAYDLGALGASDEAIPMYAGRGWKRWQGESYALTPEGVVRTEEEDDCIFVLPAKAALDLTGSLTCDWRDGSVW